MRISSLLIACALAGSNPWAQDETHPYYVQLGIGALFSEDADVGSGFGGTVGFDPGYSASLVFGRTFELSERWSWDAQFETLYQRFTVDEDDIDSVPGIDPQSVGSLDVAKSLTFFLNGILDWHLTKQFRIFGGGGVGWASTLDYNTWDQGSFSIPDDDGLAFQGRFGFAYDLGGSYDVLIGYRYYRAEPLDIDNLQPPTSTTEIDMAQHSLEFAFRWGL